MTPLPKKKPKVMRTAKTTRILDDDDSSGDDGEEVETVKNEKEKKSSSSGTRCDDKKGHCGLACRVCREAASNAVVAASKSIE